VKEGAWKRALDIFELQLFFWAGSGGQPLKPAIGDENGLNPRNLRRLRILAGMTDDQLDRFCQFTELLRVPQRATIVKQGDRGDAMYLVLQGDLRVRMNVAGTETILATLTAGDFFGDISLFDYGPRSADVMAESTALLLRLSASRFSDMARNAPDLATPFLVAIGRTLTARIRMANKHRSEAVQFARVME
jgi:CRP/FNR family transcriptional regulator/CRP/FNR family cyclic AMP-dependent transcriptional regulator